jgi:hypothetical protein
MRVLLGPLAATLVLLPLLAAGGVGATMSLVAGLFQPSLTVASIAPAGVVLLWIVAARAEVLALWVAALEESSAALRQAPLRWWLMAGLLLGLVAGFRWLWIMAAGEHSYGAQTWTVWLLLLAGPLLLGSYYLVLLSADNRVGLELTPATQRRATGW